MIPETGTTLRRRPLRYVALGDSYTIGTSVGIEERWPNQLVAALGGAGSAPPLGLLANLGVDGFTSLDVLEKELPQLDALEPEFLTLLIGVNDVIQGVSIEQYRQEVGVILDDLVGRVGPQRVLVVTSPDYTVTPAGADYGDPRVRSAAIRESNETLAALARARDIEAVDIWVLSKRAGEDRSLVAADGLHPSGRQYALWVERILLIAREVLRR
ncbi:MAG: SGNH/GDSL hydrolase family protein [Candidatus Limnocylindrales bacterium]